MSQITSHLLRTSATIAKANRWLFKYWTINRKFYKNTRKFTIFKSLISSTPAPAFNRNLWNTQFFTNFKNFSNLMLTTSLLNKNKLNFYDFNFNGKRSNDLFTNNNLLLETSFDLFEKSYFWLNKRFFFFNSLKNNNFINFWNLKKKNASFFTFKNLNPNNHARLLNELIFKFNSNNVTTFEFLINYENFKKLKKISNFDSNTGTNHPLHPVYLTFSNTNFFFKNDYYLLNSVVNTSTLWSFLNKNFNSNSALKFKNKKNYFNKSKKTSSQDQFFKIALLSINSGVKLVSWKNFITFYAISYKNN
jgi:hypothetical protein